MVVPVVLLSGAAAVAALRLLVTRVQMALRLAALALRHPLQGLQYIMLAAVVGVVLNLRVLAPQQVASVAAVRVAQQTQVD
jgi:hypothetical protein